MFKPAQFTAMGLECPICHKKLTTVGNLTFHFSCHNSGLICTTRAQTVEQLLNPKGEELVSFLEQCRELKTKYWKMYNLKFHSVEATTGRKTRCKKTVK